MAPVAARLFALRLGLPPRVGPDKLLVQRLRYGLLRVQGDRVNGAHLLMLCNPVCPHAFVYSLNERPLILA
eukprot:699271-Prorocentrum_minimum.AAC.1